MARLLKAFFFKLKNDATFKVTLIVGAGVAVFITLLYFLIDTFDSGGSFKALSGHNMLINSLSPVQNFGFAIPVNLISFVCLEFTQGTIRNKIIAGNSKFKIYVSLFLSGLVFAFALITVYALVSTALGSIFGGFDLNKAAMVGVLTGITFDGTFILQTIVCYAFIYVFLTAFAVFVATTFRVVGPAIPIVVVTLMIGYFGSMLASMSLDPEKYATVINILRFADPLFAPVGASVEWRDVGLPAMAGHAYYDNLTFIGCIVSNLAFTGIFLTAGTIEFVKRDVK